MFVDYRGAGHKEYFTIDQTVDKEYYLRIFWIKIQ